MYKLLLLLVPFLASCHACKRSFPLAWIYRLRSYRVLVARFSLASFVDGRGSLAVACLIARLLGQNPAVYHGYFRCGKCGWYI